MVKTVWIICVAAAIFMVLTMVFGFIFLDTIIFFTLPRKIVSDTGIPLPLARGIAALAAAPLAICIRWMFSLDSAKRTMGSAIMWGVTAFYIFGTYYYTLGFYYSASGEPRKCYARTPVGLAFYSAPCDAVEPKYGIKLKPVGAPGDRGDKVIIAYEWSKGHKIDVDTGQPLKFCEEVKGKLSVYLSPFHPVTGEIMILCTPDQLRRDNIAQEKQRQAELEKQKKEEEARLRREEEERKRQELELAQKAEEEKKQQELQLQRQREAEESAAAIRLHELRQKQLETEARNAELERAKIAADQRNREVEAQERQAEDRRKQAEDRRRQEEEDQRRREAEQARKDERNRNIINGVKEATEKILDKKFPRRPN